MKRLVGLTLALTLLLGCGVSFAQEVHPWKGYMRFTTIDPVVQLANSLTFKLVGTGDTFLVLGATSGAGLSRSATINSRTYLNTSGTSIGFQSKPALGATGTASVYGAQIQPRFLDAVAGGSNIGLLVEPILKGTSGDLTGNWQALQVQLTDENSSGRTIAGNAAGIRIWHMTAQTVTGGIYGIVFNSSGGATPYTGAMYFDSQAGLAGGTIGTANPCGGFIEVKIGSTLGKIPVCAN